MKKLFKPQIDGIILLWMEDTLSFYTFINLTLAECVWLYGFADIKIAKSLIVILLLGISNLIINSYVVDEFEGTVIGKVASLLYLVVFAILFIIACLIDVLIGGMLFIIPLAITGIFLEVRKIQTTASLEKTNKICTLLNNNTVSLLTQIMVLIGPVLTLTISIVMIPNLTTWIKTILIIATIAFAPALAYIEDNMAAMDIFEIAYVIWDKDEKE